MQSFWDLPQSNQRGIETRFPQLRAVRNFRLNRTSVGLKPIIGTISRYYPARLNRTSVGLKPTISHHCMLPLPLPQSNQRGIETIPIVDSPDPADRPQSNQRGIETLAWTVPPPELDKRLNRTSVGLKLTCVRVCGIVCGGPQSNQRGIETCWELTGVVFIALRASIEPAWD